MMMTRLLYLSFELFSSCHSLQLLDSHLICDLNACHLLYNLLQDQQVKTDNTENTPSDPFYTIAYTNAIKVVLLNIYRDSYV